MVSIGFELCRTINEFQPKLTNSRTVCIIKNVGYGKTHEALRNPFVVAKSGYEEPSLSMSLYQIYYKLYIFQKLIGCNPSSRILV